MYRIRKTDTTDTLARYISYPYENFMNGKKKTTKTFFFTKENKTIGKEMNAVRPCWSIHISITVVWCKAHANAA